MPSITAQLLVDAVGCPRARAEAWAAPLDRACRAFGITSAPRVAAFLAQIGHESGSLGRTVENLNYSAERLREACLSAKPGSRWRALLPRAHALARQPEKLAEAAYADRMGNGPESSGDGWNYRGRGLIQVTGKANYEAVRDLLREHKPEAPDFIADPDALSEPKWAALSAAAWWSDRGLNDLADAYAFQQITQRINGGQNGAADRRARYERARQAVLS